MILERAPANPLHDVEQPAVGKPTDVVNWDDARVFERSEDTRFELETALHCRARDFVGDLDRNLAAERLINREIHRSHSSAANLFENCVSRRGKLGPDRGVFEPGHGSVGE
jgi:hypothetical protein